MNLQADESNISGQLRNYWIFSLYCYRKHELWIFSKILWYIRHVYSLGILSMIAIAGSPRFFPSIYFLACSLFLPSCVQDGWMRTWSRSPPDSRLPPRWHGQDKSFLHPVNFSTKLVDTPHTMLEKIFKKICAIIRDIYCSLDIDQPWSEDRLDLQVKHHFAQYLFCPIRLSKPSARPLR